MGIIYKITNKTTNKIYIGQTTRTLAERWREHVARSNPSDGTYLHNSIAKYGDNNFLIEEVLSCEDGLLDKNEIEQIIKHNSLYPSGYNLTRGGDGNPKFDHSLIVSLWEHGKGIGEIADIVGCATGTVTKHLYGLSSYSEDEAKRRGYSYESAEKRKKGVNQYTWDGKFVKHYNSVMEVTKGDRISANHLSSTCRGERTMWNNYQWRYDTDDAPSALDKPYFSKRRIEQYSLDGELLKIFPSAAAAAREVSPAQNSNVVANQILQVCKHNRKTAKGYRWEYADIYE